MCNQPLVSDDILQKTAFDLLTSSAIRRYSQMARENGEKVILAFKEQNITYSQLMERIQFLSEKVISQSTMRSMEEVELVLLLTVMVKFDKPEVDFNLKLLSERTEPSMLWIAAYSEQLLKTEKMFLWTKEN